MYINMLIICKKASLTNETCFPYFINKCMLTLIMRLTCVYDIYNIFYKNCVIYTGKHIISLSFFKSFVYIKYLHKILSENLFVNASNEACVA